MALNGGTTTSEVARALATRPDLQDGAGTPAVTVIASDADPLVALIGAQRLAAELAGWKGIDPDQPRALSRSVILTG